MALLPWDGQCSPNLRHCLHVSSPQRVEGREGLLELSGEVLLCSVLSANLQLIGACISSFHPSTSDPSPCPGPWAGPSPPEEQQSRDSPHAGRLRAAGTVFLSTSSSYCTLQGQAGGSA